MASVTTLGRSRTDCESQPERRRVVAVAIRAIGGRSRTGESQGSAPGISWYLQAGLKAGAVNQRILRFRPWPPTFSARYASAKSLICRMTRAGLTQRGACHLLRHAMATHMLHNGVDVRHLQAILGHADLGTTARQVPKQNGPEGPFASVAGCGAQLARRRIVTSPTMPTSSRPSVPGSGTAAGLISPNRPCSSSPMPAAKYRSSASLSIPPLPNTIPHR